MGDLFPMRSGPSWTPGLSPALGATFPREMRRAGFWCLCVIFGVTQSRARIPETPSPADTAGGCWGAPGPGCLYPTLPVPITPVSCAPSPVCCQLAIKKRCVTHPLRGLFGGFSVCKKGKSKGASMNAGHSPPGLCPENPCPGQVKAKNPGKLGFMSGICMWPWCTGLLTPWAMAALGPAPWAEFPR